MRIHGARVANPDARRLVASLFGTNWPDAHAAAFRIARGLDRGAPDVTLEPVERDAVLRFLVDPPDALVELRGALARDFRRRTSALGLQTDIQRYRKRLHLAVSAVRKLSSS